MRLAISNIAWDAAEDTQVCQLLERFAVDAIDVAPGKYFPDPANTSDAAITQVRRWWHERGIEITGMQALLFGTQGLNVFAAPPVQQAMLDHLAAVCRIGAGLGATRMVFGSPKNRDRRGLDDQQALAVAVPFFQRLGDIAQAHGVTICLEPNPTCYGCNFMTANSQTATVVTQVNHPAIKMQLDTGSLTINGEDPHALLREHAALIGHIHASEPDLLALGDGSTDHADMSAAVHHHLLGHVVTIEMLAGNHEPHLQSIERALQVASHHYRRQSEEAHP